MVKSEQSRSQGMIGLPFTVYCLPHALRSALSVMGAAQGWVFWVRIHYFFKKMDLFCQTDLSQEGQLCISMN
jgi:hypothetical protein